MKFFFNDCSVYVQFKNILNFCASPAPLIHFCKRTEFDNRTWTVPYSGARIGTRGIKGENVNEKNEWRWIICLVYPLCSCGYNFHKTRIRSDNIKEKILEKQITAHTFLTSLDRYILLTLFYIHHLYILKTMFLFLSDSIHSSSTFAPEENVFCSCTQQCSTLLSLIYR